MPQQRQIEAGEFFYRFFKKRTSSFHANLYKAGITASETDIHRARVDVKKVFAVFSFFEMLDPVNFHQKKYAALFRTIFNEAGKMRENQVSILSMEQYLPEYPGVSLFIKFLKAEQKKSTKGFINAVIQFDELKLKEISKSIKRLCGEIKSEEIIGRSEEYIRKKAKRIRSVTPFVEKPENVHKIRKDLKKIGAIATLLKQITPGEYLENLLALITKTETFIGEWHDRIILIDSFNRFFKSNVKADQESIQQLKELKEFFVRDASNKLEILMPYVDEVVSMAFEKFEKENPPPKNKINQGI